MLSAHTERVGAQTRAAARVNTHGQAECPTGRSEVRAGSSSAPPSSIACCSAVLNRARTRRGAWLGASCARREGRRESYRERKTPAASANERGGDGEKGKKPAAFQIWVAAVARCFRHTRRGSGLELGGQLWSTRMGRLSAPQEDRRSAQGPRPRRRPQSHVAPRFSTALGGDEARG